MSERKILIAVFVGIFLNGGVLGKIREIDPKIGDYDESLGEFIREILENFRSQMETGIPEIGVPPVDPLSIPNIDERINDGNADMVLRMRNLSISHLSMFEIKDLAADLQKGVAYVNILVPKLRATGFCYMNGKIIGIFPISSDGNFHIEVEDVDIEGFGLLNLTTDGDVNLHMNDLNLSLKFGPLKIVFDSLLGGGRWTQTLLKLVTGLGRNLFMHFHEKAMKELDKVLLKVINKELDKGTLKEILDKIPLPSVIKRRSVRRENTKH